MLIRVDDFPHGGSMDRPDRWKMMEHLMDNLDLPIMLACVPSETTLEDIARLRQDKRITIGVHGISHSRGDQALDISAWKSARDKFGLPTPRVYVAPYNEYTESDVKKAGQVGYFTITAGPETNTKIIEWVQGTGLNIVMDTELYGHSWKIMDKVRNRHGLRGCLNLHLTWEWNSKASHLQELHRILDGHVEKWT